MTRILFKEATENILFARQLRKSGNPAEKYLWSRLRCSQFFGLKFRKQVPLGGYIVDFLCVSKRIVIEIDGESHYTPKKQEHDRQRDVYLQTRGFIVVRIGHKETLKNIDGILERLRLVIGVEYH